jgi:hypothetical protein
MAAVFSALYACRKLASRCRESNAKYPLQKGEDNHTGHVNRKPLPEFEPQVDQLVTNDSEILHLGISRTVEIYENTADLNCE